MIPSGLTRNRRMKSVAELPVLTTQKHLLPKLNSRSRSIAHLHEEIVSLHFVEGDNLDLPVSTNYIDQS